MDDELKKCFFCGSEAEELATGYVACSNYDCGSYGYELSVEDWNTRD